MIHRPSAAWEGGGRPLPKTMMGTWADCHPPWIRQCQHGDTTDGTDGGSSIVLRGEGFVLRKDIEKPKASMAGHPSPENVEIFR